MEDFRQCFQDELKNLEPVLQRSFDELAEVEKSLYERLQNLKSRHPDFSTFLEKMPFVLETNTVRPRPVLMEPLFADSDPLVQRAIAFAEAEGDGATHQLVFRNVPGAGKSGATMAIAKRRAHVLMQFSPRGNGETFAENEERGPWIDTNYQVYHGRLVKWTEPETSPPADAALLLYRRSYWRALIISQVEIISRLTFINQFLRRHDGPDRFSLLARCNINGGRLIVQRIVASLMTCVEPFFSLGDGGAVPQSVGQLESMSNHLATVVSSLHAEFNPIYIFDEVQNGENFKEGNVLPRRHSVMQMSKDPDVPLDLSSSSNFRGPLYYLAIYALPPRDTVRVVLTGTRVTDGDAVSGYEDNVMDARKDASPVAPAIHIVTQEMAEKVLVQLFPSISENLKRDIASCVAGRVRLIAYFLYRVGMLLTEKDTRPVDSLLSLVRANVENRFREAFHKRMSHLYDFPSEIPSSLGVANAHPSLKFLISFWVALSTHPVVPLQLRAVHREHLPSMKNGQPFDAEDFSFMRLPLDHADGVPASAETLTGDGVFSVACPDLRVAPHVLSLLSRYRSCPRDHTNPEVPFDLERGFAVALAIRSRGVPLKQFLAELGIKFKDRDRQWTKNFSWLKQAIPLWYNWLEDGPNGSVDATADAAFFTGPPATVLYKMVRPCTAMGPDLVGIAPLFNTVDAEVVRLCRDVTKRLSVVLVVASVAYRRTTTKCADQKVKNKVENFYHTTDRITNLELFADDRQRLSLAESAAKLTTHPTVDCIFQEFDVIGILEIACLQHQYEKGVVHLSKLRHIPRVQLELRGPPTLEFISGATRWSKCLPDDS